MTKTRKVKKVKRAPNAKELDELRRIFLKAETDIINEIGRLRTLGNIDYHAVAALNRVQKILQGLADDCWEYVPKMIEKQFYVNTPEARRITEPVKKHIAGYRNAEALTATQLDVINILTNNLMGEIIDAAETINTNLKDVIVGRREDDISRRVSLKTVALAEAKGENTRKHLDDLVQQLNREGMTAFVDKAGRHWSLHAYGDMVCRTTSRQAQVLATLTADGNHDLYKISSHSTPCPICAPLEGRVYSKSGKDKDFPPLALAFGKVDKDGPDELTNTWLNIHPNCLVPGGTILAEGVMAHSSREYSGKIITFKTSTGNKISITPNHPILTTKGFVPASSLKKGDKIIETTSEYALFFGKTPNNINIPTSVEDIGHSLVKSCGGTATRMKGSAIQFHGDGVPNSEVNIVFSNRFGINEIDFLNSTFNSIGSYAEMFSNLSIREPLLSKRLQDLHSNNVLVVSELVHLDTSNYCGKVYNLQTKFGFYTYNNIVTHNCLHVLIPWTPAGRTDEEIQKIKDFSSFKKNPPTRDPRSQKQIEAYRKSQRARAKRLNDYKQWERYKLALGNKVPKTFETFMKHKNAEDEKYKLWEKEYRKRFYLQNRLDYTFGKEDSFIPQGAVFETVKTIAGSGSKTEFRHAQDYADMFGGNAADWSKKVGKIESAKYIFDVHWVEKDGKQYAAKVKHRKEK